MHARKSGVVPKGRVYEPQITEYKADAKSTKRGISYRRKVL
jgi:hypothetical protein